MIYQIVQSIIRHGLTSGGAILVTKGLASQSDTDAAVGALMVLIGFAHSIYNKWKLSQPQPAKPALTAPRQSNVAPLMLLALSSSLFFSGCQTTPQELSYQAAGTTIVTVDTAMNLWGAYVASNHPSTNEEAAVKSAFEKYQTAMALACDAGAAYAATGGTNSTATAALNQAVANSSQELLDLENLITSFGVKLQ
jgi:hypothetical protein